MRPTSRLRSRCRPIRRRVAGQWKQLDLAFAAGSFRSGDRLAFGVDRDEADQAGTLNGAAGGNSADLLGGGVLHSGRARLRPAAAELLRHLPGRHTVPGPVLQPDRQGLQPARRLRLRQCRGGGEGGFEEEEIGRFRRPEQGPHRLPVRALLFVVKCARLAILSFYLPLAAHLVNRGSKPTQGNRIASEPTMTARLSLSLSVTRDWNQ